MLCSLAMDSGSASTKIRVFDDEQSLLKETIRHDEAEAGIYQILKDIELASAVLIGYIDAIILTDEKI